MFSKLFQTHLIVGFIALTINVQSILADSSWNPKQTPYPKAKTVDKTFSFASAKAGKNVTYADPYFWLEDDPEKDADVKKFITDQTMLTETYMRKCTSKQTITDTVKSAYDYNVIEELYHYASPDVKDPFYIYSLKRLGEDLPTYYIATDAEMKKAQKNNFEPIPGKKFFDQKLLSPNGTASVGGLRVSAKTGIIAYLVQELNNDIGTWYFRKLSDPLVDSSKPIIPGGAGRFDDFLPFATGGLTYVDDDKAVVYVTTNNNTDQVTSVYHHVIGTPTSNDIVIIDPEPVTSDGSSVYWDVISSFDGHWLVVMATIDFTYHARVYATQLTPGQTYSNKMKWIGLAPGYDYTFGVFQILDNTIYVTTDQDAPDGKLVKVNLDWSKAKTYSKSLNEITDKADLITVVPERPKSTVNAAAPIGSDKAIAVYIEEGKYVNYLYDLKTGKQIEKVLPKELSNVYSIYYTFLNGNSVNVIYQNLLTPQKIYEITCKEGSDDCPTELLTVSEIKGVKDTDYPTKEYAATSKDGTQVPYFVTCHKGVKPNTNGLLHVFGHYGVVETFIWRPVFFAYAVSYKGCVIWGSPRGGGDEGAQWHKAGEGILKQNTYDDIVAIAEDLAKRNIVAKGKLVIDGGSAGGMSALVAANQAPSNTFGSVLAGGPTCDYFLRRRSPEGADNDEEFGNPYNATEFDYVIEWSPYQNIKNDHVYPAILFTPRQGDTHVTPANAYKCLARLQADLPTSPNPFLLHLVQGGRTVNGLATDVSVAEAVHQLCTCEVSMGLTNYRAKK